mmetsp:Transcript_8073/g.11965  ORF Transcript_8073/g.11965 Transcript_8073/m.11965 type:complete len:243 (-) Transcript_8073:225-953(-)
MESDNPNTAGGTRLSVREVYWSAVKLLVSCFGQMKLLLFLIFLSHNSFLIFAWLITEPPVAPLVISLVLGFICGWTLWPMTYKSMISVKRGDTWDYYSCFECVRKRWATYVPWSLLIILFSPFAILLPFFIAWFGNTSVAIVGGEGLGLISGMKRSKELGAGRYLRVFVTIVFPPVLYEVIVSLLLYVFSRYPDTIELRIMRAVLFLCLSPLMICFHGVLFVCLYDSLVRTRENEVELQSNQ